MTRDVKKKTWRFALLNEKRRGQNEMLAPTRAGHFAHQCHDYFAGLAPKVKPRPVVNRMLLFFFPGIGWLTY